MTKGKKTGPSVPGDTPDLVVIKASLRRSTPWGNGFAGDANTEKRRTKGEV